MKSFKNYLGTLKNRSLKKRLGDAFATVALTGAIASSPLAKTAASIHQTIFPDPWKQLQPYLKKHPTTGRLYIDEDELDEKQKKHVHSLLSQLEQMSKPKEK